MPAPSFASPPNGGAWSAASLFTVPVLFAATHVEPCPTTFRPPAVPVPSTPLSSETVTGVVVDEESWQLSDTYRPVEVPVDGCVAAYEIASVTRDAEPALAASAGAVPRTAIFPFTADCQVVPIASVPRRGRGRRERRALRG